jgi:hypothetical protein
VPFTVGDSATRSLIQNQPLLLSSQLRHADRFYGDTRNNVRVSPKVGSTARLIWTPRVVQESSQCACNSEARSNSERGGPPYIPTTTGDVKNLADEIKPGHGPRSRRLRRKPRYIDAAQRHLRGAVAFGSVRPDAPLLHIGYDTHENESVMRFVVGYICPSALRFCSRCLDLPPSMRRIIF